MRKPALLVRFPAPVLRRPPPEETWPDDVPLLPADADTTWPTLAGDFALWRTEFEATFRRLDHEALLAQHRFWRQQVTLILGGLLLTVLGAWQTAAGAGTALAVVQALLTGLLTGVAAVARTRRSQHDYLTHRLQAERIKSEFFLFLGRVGDFDGAHREQHLRQRIEDIAGAGGST